ncbi:uncharacterized protein [Littorina saxatilis]|uniref:uncharacterized protein n=1 Tax=Littorina saxatilis TaxID=31220 RepID=UPI0038B63653
MLTSCFRLLTRVARQPATFCSEFSARQRFVRIFHHLSGISTTEFTTMSDNEEWERVQNSGKSKKKDRKGNQTSPEKPKKGNEKRPQTTNGTASKTAKEGSVVTPKDKKPEKAVESPAKNEFCPWLNVSSEDSDDGAKNTSTTDTNTSEKKKKPKKKKKKNKDKQDSDHDAKTPKGDSAETTSPQVTNGVKPDSDKTTAPKSTETKSESQEATGEESTKTTTAKSSESTQPDDDDAPMNWEDAVVEQEKASEDKSHAAVADEEKSSASQASAEETSKGKIPTDNSEGEGSPSKKMTDSSASDKPVSFGWKKSHSNEKLQTGARERDRQGSTERKHTFKKPEANPADGNSNTKRNTSARDRSNERRSDSKEKGRQGSADGSRSDSNKTPRRGSGDRTESDSTAGSRQVPWEQSGKNNSKRVKHDGTGKSGKKGDQGAAGGWPVEKEQPRIDCQPIVGFELKETKGDLFSCAVDDAMAHCVSQYLEMGKGIAVYLKQGKVSQLRAQSMV